jgi:zinc/manganese transport system permease protein
MLLLGLAVAVGVQVVGALLVLSVLVTPAAAALRISSSPLWVPVLSSLFATVSLVGGILLALGASVPISPYVTTISFLIYVICRVASSRRARRARRRRTLVTREVATL